jgi:hypothetical protein
MKIAAQSAVIKTAQVEIKTLSVSGKQVTLAVFRQLDQADLIDYATSKLNGIPWGRINYHPDKCGDSSSAHLHIVWQKDADLYRARVNKKIYHHESLTEAANLAEYLLFNYPDFCYEAIEMKGDIRRYASAYSSRTEEIKSITTAAQQAGYFNTRSFFEAPEGDLWIQRQFNRYTEELLKHKKIQDFHDQVYQNLESLDLLFIAV